MGEGKGSTKPSEIKKCNCKHQYQDEKYGSQNRVHNPNGKGEYKCTVCSSVKR